MRVRRAAPIAAYSASRRSGVLLVSLAFRGENAPERAICARMSESVESLPLPADPNLAAYASALNDAGHWADVFDATWGYLFATDELRLSYGDTGAATVLPIGSHFFSAGFTQFRLSANRGGFAQPEFRRAHFLEIAP